MSDPKPTYEELVEALETLASRESQVLSKFQLWGPADSADAMKREYANAKSLLTRIRQGGESNG